MPFQAYLSIILFDFQLNSLCQYKLDKEQF
jgi:hypothetical protein